MKISFALLAIIAGSFKIEVPISLQFNIEIRFNIPPGGIEDMRIAALVYLPFPEKKMPLFLQSSTTSLDVIEMQVCPDADVRLLIT